VQYMILLRGDALDTALVAGLEQYFAALGNAGALLAAERLHEGEGATVSLARGSATPIVTRGVSSLRAFWSVKVASKQAAISIARGIPGSAGELDLFEIYAPEDFPSDPAEVPGGWREQDEQRRAAPPPVARMPGTTRYLAMIRSDAQSEAGMLPTERTLTAMQTYIGELSRTNPMLGGAGLKPSSRAVRLRQSGDARNVVDGPFTESKEMIAGYMILPAASLEEAIERIQPWLVIHAAATPAPESAIEVRALIG